MTTPARKIVLVCPRVYEAARDEALLRGLLAAGVELFCAAGPAAASWEDAMDWLCVDLDGPDARCVTTTAHPEETVEEVIRFADAFCISAPSPVEVRNVA